MAAELHITIDRMQYRESVDSTQLIESLRFSITRERIVALLGPTGAGKTTLMRIIAGLEQHYHGSVTINNERVCRPSRAIQMVFQDYRLLPFKTVRQNLAFAINGNSKDSKERVDHWLRIVGMAHRGDAYPKTLSGGEAGRVALARAFISPPEVLLLDEPFRNLDIVARFDLQDELIKVLNVCKTTVLMISHSIEDAVYLADEIILLSHRPMTINTRLTIDFPRPRRRDDPRLAQMVADVARSIVDTGHPTV